MSLKDIVNRLVSSGLSEKKIAELSGASQPTINRIKKGRTHDPSYSVGAALVKLHAERCPLEHDEDVA